MKHARWMLLLLAMAGDVASAQGVYHYFPVPGTTYSLGSGMTIGTPTGGAQGAGTLNAQGLYVNGLPVGGGGGGSPPGGSNGQIQYNNAGLFGGFTPAGDCFLILPNFTCTGTNGVPFGTFATANAATPPAIGGTTPAAGSFSALTDTAINGSTQCVHANTAGVLSGTGSDCGSGGGSSAFSALTGGTNTAAAMVVGTGASLGVAGSGTIGATSVPATGITAGNLPSGVKSTAGNTLLDTASVLNGANISAATTPLTALAAQATSTCVANTTGSLAVPTAVPCTVVSSNGTNKQVLFGNAGGSPAFATPPGLVLTQSGIPFIYSKATVGNNCALSAIPTLPTTYASGYFYFPAGTIATGVPASGTWEYVVMSSATAGTCFNNAYAGGTPTIPGSPTAFATTGPGAFTQSTSAIIEGPTATVAGNLMGINGEIQVDGLISYTSDGNTKKVAQGFGPTSTTTCNTTFQTANQQSGFLSRIRNRGVANSQVCANGQGFGDVTGSGSGYPLYFATDTTSSQTEGIWVGTNNTADMLVLESYSIKVYPN